MASRAASVAACPARLENAQVQVALPDPARMITDFVIEWQPYGAHRMDRRERLQPNPKGEKPWH
jgi:anti-sigma factor ChrR (cupin superfamily)